jgi:hypothetical protein
LLETLCDVERKRGVDMVDSAIVRAHHCAVAIKRELEIKRPKSGWSAVWRGLRSRRAR